MSAGGIVRRAATAELLPAASLATTHAAMEACVSRSHRVASQCEHAIGCSHTLVIVDRELTRSRPQISTRSWSRSRAVAMPAALQLMAAK
jgi:hypothetical protein